MNESSKPKGSETKADWLAPPEDMAAGAAALAGTALAGPVGAIVAGGLVKAIGQLLRKRIGERGAARAEQFEEQVINAFDSPAEIETRLESREFQEVTFQNFRRAMDAIDPCVLPALGRLTAMYRDSSPDAFFRGTGRLLQDLGPDELIALRQLLSAAITLDEPVVQIVSWEKPGGWELLFSKERPKPADEVIGLRRHLRAIPVLELMQRAGLLHEEGRAGQDMALTGGYELSKNTIERLLVMVEAIDVDVHPSAFTH